MKKTALFPGSFDPFTLGHQAIVEDGLKIFDRIVVGIGSNSEKNGLLTVENRKRLIEDLYMMVVNQMLFPEITTVLLFTPPRYVAISSSIIRELIAFGGDPTGLMPDNIDIKNYL